MTPKLPNGQPATAGTAAAAAAAAAAASGRPPGGGLGAWWNNLVNQPSLQHHVGNFRTHLKKQKFVMPVDVKVDFIKPAIQTVQETLTTVWVGLPPPVQAAAPYVGVGLASGALVFAVQQRRVNYHRQKAEQLQLDVKRLGKERGELLQRINTLKAKSGAPRTEVEARLASAVAEAANAAAAAADAAARAATACIIQRPPLQQLPLPSQQQLEAPGPMPR